MDEWGFLCPAGARRGDEVQGGPGKAPGRCRVWGLGAPVTSETWGCLAAPGAGCPHLVLCCCRSRDVVTPPTHTPAGPPRQDGPPVPPTLPSAVLFAQNTPSAGRGRARGPDPGLATCHRDPHTEPTQHLPGHRCAERAADISSTDMMPPSWGPRAASVHPGLCRSPS